MQQMMLAFIQFINHLLLSLLLETFFSSSSCLYNVHVDLIYALYISISTSMVIFIIRYKGWCLNLAILISKFYQQKLRYIIWQYKSRHYQTTSFETTFEISTYNLHKINELLQIDMNRA